MGSFLAETKGFTPVIDVIAQDVGLISAVVYGVAWRYCQMEDKICKASIETIAERVGINRKTAERHVKKLCDAGYLKDLTPDRKNAPHEYADTGKVKINALISGEGKTESPSPKEVGLKVGAGSDIKSYRGKTLSPTKIDSKESTEDNTVDASASTGEKTRHKSQLLPITPEAKRMFERIGANQRAKGRRGATRFPTLECKEKFDAAIAILGSEFEPALTKALEQGITKITGVTSYIAKWAQNIRKAQQPGHIKVKA